MLNHKLQNVLGRTGRAVLCSAVLSFIAFPLAANAAEYSVELLDGPLPADPSYNLYPETYFTDVTDSGLVVFQSSSWNEYFYYFQSSGLYDMKSGEFTILGTYDQMGDVQTGFSPYGISAKGAMVSSSDCQVADKYGNVTQPIPAGNDLIECQARGVANNGVISGWSLDQEGIWNAFVYNPKKDDFVEYISTPIQQQTIAQGINSQGQTVGGTGTQSQSDGFVRDKKGSIRYFKVQIDGVSYGTRARGINSDETIVGFFSLDGVSHGFVGRLSDDPDDENLIPDAVYGPAEIPECDFDVIFARINNDGVIAGSCRRNIVEFPGAITSQGMLLIPIPVVE